MAINTKYIVLASGGAATVIGGGVGTHYLLQDKTTKDELTSQNETNNNQTNTLATKLTNKGYTILTNDSEHWETILESYKTVAKEGNKLRFGTFAGTESEAREELSRHCLNLLKPDTSENVENPDNFKKAEKWCVTPVTVADILKKERYTPITINNTDNSVQNNDVWATKVKEHKKSNKKINDLGLDESKDTATDEEIRKIKTKCTEIGGKKNHEAEYETNLEHFKNWCSNRSN